MATDRRARVLNAIVQDYEPVNRWVRAPSLSYHLGVSPATVRNDMAALEEAGLIHQPHTSAGRVPTDAGYRQFVDQISSPGPLPCALSARQSSGCYTRQWIWMRSLRGPCASLPR